MPHRGFELTSSRSGVRGSNQIASWPVELVFISGGFYNPFMFANNAVVLPKFDPLTATGWLYV